MPRSCRATVEYVLLGMRSTTGDQQLRFLITRWLQVSWAMGETCPRREQGRELHSHACFGIAGNMSRRGKEGSFGDG